MTEIFDRLATSDSIEIILCWAFVGVLWILARHIGYREGFKDGYKQGEKDFKPRKGADRPRGEWIVNISDYKSACSVCGANETDFIYGTEMWYGLGESEFCPSCGARMKGAINDN